MDGLITGLENTSGAHEFCFGHVEFDMSVRHPRDRVSQAAGYTNLERRVFESFHSSFVPKQEGPFFTTPLGQRAGQSLL